MKSVFTVLVLIAFMRLVILDASEVPITGDELIALGFQNDPKQTEGRFVWSNLPVGVIAKRLKLELSHLEIVKSNDSMEVGRIKLRGATVSFVTNTSGRGKGRLREPATLCSGTIFVPQAQIVMSDDAIALRQRLLKLGFSEDSINPKIFRRRKSSAGEVRKIFDVPFSSLIPLPGQGVNSDIRAFRIPGGLIQIRSRLTSNVRSSLDNDDTPCDVDAVLDNKK